MVDREVVDATGSGLEMTVSSELKEQGKSFGFISRGVRILLRLAS